VFHLIKGLLASVGGIAAPSDARPLPSSAAGNAEQQKARGDAERLGLRCRTIGFRLCHAAGIARGRLCGLLVPARRLDRIGEARFRIPVRTDVHLLSVGRRFRCIAPKTY
jgi:hypothetical protein